MPTLMRVNASDQKLKQKKKTNIEGLIYWPVTIKPHLLNFFITKCTLLELPEQKSFFLEHKHVFLPIHHALQCKSKL